MSSEVETRPSTSLATNGGGLRTKQKTLTSRVMDPNAPLLFFDSGVGGLSVLEPTRALLPTAPIVYVADNAGYPYGTKSDAELAERLPVLLGRLVEHYHPRLAVIACNTASTLSLIHI